jgi:hypothetical protein
MPFKRADFQFLTQLRHWRTNGKRATIKRAAPLDYAKTAEI